MSRHGRCWCVAERPWPISGGLFRDQQAGRREETGAVADPSALSAVFSGYPIVLYPLDR